MAKLISLSEHVKSNQAVRDTLTARGIYPENLPAQQDIKKIERKLNSDGKKIGKNKFVKAEIE